MENLKELNSKELREIEGGDWLDIVVTGLVLTNPLLPLLAGAIGTGVVVGGAFSAGWNAAHNAH